MQLAPEPVQRLHGTDLYLVPQSLLVRAGAYLIDSALVALLTLPFVYGKTMQALISGPDATTFQLAVVGGLCLYFFLWEGAVGWTPGKRALRLRVVALDGGPCGWRRSLLRNVLRPLDLVFFGVIGAMSMAAGFRRQRLGDRLAGTTVARALPLPQVPLPYVPAEGAAQRCGHCGALQPAERSVCESCGARLGAGAAHAGRSARAPALSSTRGPSRPLPPRGALSRLGLELRADDDGTRLTAARETLVGGRRPDVSLLADLIAGWSEGDRQFVIDVSRTLDGWRPRMVLEALRNDPNEGLAAAAVEALATVAQRGRAADASQAPPSARGRGGERTPGR
jgi:uncharacterized RDD family membrane protein YckC